MPQVGPQGAQSISNAYKNVVLEAMIFVSLRSPRFVRLELNAARHGHKGSRRPLFHGRVDVYPDRDVATLARAD
jgi:hypothetical protein